jgi:hypothetical protein
MMLLDQFLHLFVHLQAIEAAQNGLAQLSDISFSMSRKERVE